MISWFIKLSVLSFISLIVIYFWYLYQFIGHCLIPIAHCIAALFEEIIVLVVKKKYVVCLLLFQTISLLPKTIKLTHVNVTNKAMVLENFEGPC